MSYILSTDSTCDLPFSFYKEENIPYLGMDYTIGGKDYREGSEESLPIADFYKLLREGETSTTVQINGYRFTEFARPLLEAGNDLLHICFSSGLSGTFASCSLAVKDLREEFPDRKIEVVDSLCASLGEGLLVWYANENRKAGMSFEDNVRWLQDHRLSLCHWFTVDDLMYLHRGGRVSKASAILGSLLGVKPVLHVDDEGHLILVSKARGRKASLQAMVTKMKTSMLPEQKAVFISHGDATEDAEYMAGLVTEQTGCKVTLINHIGTIIGSHSGPGTVALFFLGNAR